MKKRMTGWRKTIWRTALRTAAAAMAAAAAGLLAAAFSVSAHAVLESAIPEPDARLAESPPYVELVFNESVDARAAFLQVLDSDSKAVAKGAPEPAAGGRGVRAALPELGEGHYTVSYRVISADGHPVSGAFVFTVGEPPARPAAEDYNPHRQIGHVHDHGTGGLTLDAFLLYAARFLYYAGLLAAAGLALWSWQRRAPEEVRDAREAGIRLAGRFLVLAALCHVFFQLNDLNRGLPLEEWVRVLTRTAMGGLLLATLGLAVLSLALAVSGPLVRLLWAAAALAVEAGNGHAATGGFPALTIALDAVHLAAASLWTGGLLLLVAVWRRQPTEAARFALLFSRWALGSFAVLWVTGTLYTLEILPAVEYLTLTAWGGWLLAKSALVLAVMAVAFFIRRRLRRGRVPSGALLVADAGLLGAIVLSVAVLTYQIPLPSNEPLYWHRMGEDLHLTLRVSPKAPGDNAFIVKVWLPEDVNGGLPKNVQLRLRADGRMDSFIDVPLQPYEDKELDAFEGYTKTTYRAEGPYLPFRGKWTAQIRVTDGTDTERVLEREFRVY